MSSTRTTVANEVRIRQEVGRQYTTLSSEKLAEMNAKKENVHMLLMGEVVIKHNSGKFNCLYEQLRLILEILKIGKQKYAYQNAFIAANLLASLSHEEKKMLSSL